MGEGLPGVLKRSGRVRSREEQPGEGAHLPRRGHGVVDRLLVARPSDLAATATMATTRFTEAAPSADLWGYQTARVVPAHLVGALISAIEQL